MMHSDIFCSDCTDLCTKLLLVPIWELLSDFEEIFLVLVCVLLFFLGVFFDKYNPPITIKMKNIFVGLLVMLYYNMFILYGSYDNFRKRVWIYIFLNGFVHKIYGQIGNNVIKNM